MRATEIYEALESEEHQQGWAPPNINIVPKQRAYWMYGPNGEVDGISWDLDSAFRRFHSQPPIDDMLRPLIIPPGGITVQVMEENTRRCPNYPYAVERVPTPEEEPSPTWSSDPEEKEEGDLIETKDSEDADERAPDLDFRGPPPPPGSTYLNQNIGDTGVPQPFSAQSVDGWMACPPSTTTTHGPVTAASDTTPALPSLTLSGTTTTVSPTESAARAMLPGWGPTARNTGHGTRAAARAQSNTTVTSVVTQTRSGDGGMAETDHGSGARPTTIPVTVNTGAHGTGETTIAYTSTSVPTHQATASSSDILSPCPLINTEAPPAATGGAQDSFSEVGQNAESDDWNTQGEPVFQANTPQAPEPPLPPRPNRRQASKTKGTKKKSNKKGR